MVNATPLADPCPLEVDRLHADLRAGRRRALARAISWVENAEPKADALLERVYGSTPRPWVVGVTGVGGAGKSSLVPHLARCLAAMGAPSRKIAVLAVDPSSPVTGGALLGDRIRDTASPADDRIYFRSVASRGGPGGLSTCIADLVRLAAAAGHEVVIIETVGAGQSELGILEVAHTVLLVHAPGLGDDVQAQKAGIMEMADVMVVNKADRPDSEDAIASLRQALRLSEHRAHLADGLNAADEGPLAWQPPVLPTSALRGTGVDDVCLRLQEHREFLQRSGRWTELDSAHDLRRMQTFLMQTLQQRLQQRVAQSVTATHLRQEVARGQMNPLTAARHLADALCPWTAQDSQPA
jgi:LAO/AO transport system kinase